jgi:hypothetical protein
MSSSRKSTLTPHQLEIIKRALESLVLEGHAVSETDALAAGQEFFSSDECKDVERMALALKSRVNSFIPVVGSLDIVEPKDTSSKLPSSSAGLETDSEKRSTRT